MQNIKLLNLTYAITNQSIQASSAMNRIKKFLIKIPVKETMSPKKNKKVTLTIIADVCKNNKIKPNCKYTIQKELGPMGQDPWDRYLKEEKCN